MPHRHRVDYETDSRGTTLDRLVDLGDIAGEEELEEAQSDALCRVLVESSALHGIQGGREESLR